MFSTNPFFRTQSFLQRGISREEGVMTINGVVTKTIVLLLCTALTFIWSWQQFFSPQGNPQLAFSALQVGGLAGFILALVTSFKREWSPATAPLYALCKGCVLGGISALLERSYPGIAFQAITLTCTTLFAMLIIYRMRLIQVTEKFVFGITAVTCGVCLFYLCSFLFSLFGVASPIYGTSLFSIGFSLFVVVLAASHLLLDFHMIERGEAHGLPKYMEWYSALGLLITLFWLYIEIIQLLSKIARRRD